MLPFYSGMPPITKLVYWGRLTAIDVGDEDTHYTVFPILPLRAGHKPQDLILQSTREPIAEGFIRPYAVCHTPKFLRKKSL